MLSTDLIPLTERFSPERYREFVGEVTKKRVLIVESESTTQESLMKVLMSIDPEIMIDMVLTAEEAEEKLDEGENYSLILTDLLLSGELSGVDLWEYCEENYPEIPLVVVSEIGIRQFLEWVGPFRVCPLYLQKPFYLEECREVLEGVLDSEEDEEARL